ncbi:MAG: enoyl-CoA hydratase/isomerase family protein [Halobacteria archaeon]|nr:enoyl-CoA hydratase/isomerase family protein [Halobacteria archaeon]
MIEYELRDDAVAWITLERPEKRNSLTLYGMRRIVDSLGRAEDEAAVAVLTGNEDIFCAGGDLTEVDSVETEEEADEFAATVIDLFRSVEGAEIPVVGAVNGDAYGAGFETVIACDLAVAAENSMLGLPETRIGLYPPYPVERLSDNVGRKRQMELVLTGEPISAEKALDWGLVNRVVPAESLDSAVNELISPIVSASDESVRRLKRHAVDRMVNDDERDRMVETLSHLLRTDEARERVDRAVND